MDHRSIPLLVASGGALVASVLAFRWHKARKSNLERRSLPVLCFGDSITAGYHGVWAHPIYGPENPNGDELVHARCHPYSLALGGRLGQTCEWRDALHFAETVAYAGWSARQLLPKLKWALSGACWRAVVILAGTNDAAYDQVDAQAIVERIARLHRACDVAGVPVVVITPPDCELEWTRAIPGCGDPDTRRAILSDVARLLATRCSQEKRVVVDGRATLPYGPKYAELWDDTVHPSLKGSDELGAAVFDAIMKAGL
mmetsp:Transcript_23883/g.39495  ORF Transcript_23883/g.39495 Transcript_23883/m.39495 type:complete len:257 (+) Transcript_23883:78-848(+)|eukprot:CAMPEP_0119318000 /NCGR_PEP_ID=MMETSP1333-20130426/45241_1 /TAXON_ID=418940 /ORGANISM="Scyphosphaera apsteinii, Strain RCC1455" /LENGTH=256 /DNA_ID=CAMNT_0007324089 /DNA_START=78 /DNA_END=848 /DNA_ORIENTATION=+